MSTDSAAKCPHCESRFGYPTMPTLDGREVYICASCEKVAPREEWNR